MSSLNKIIIIGRLTQDPELKVTTNGANMATMTVAVDRPSQSDFSATDFINVVGWRETADNAQGLSKGQMVLVSGRINTRSYETNEGTRKYVTEIDARQIKAVSGSGAGAMDNPAETDTLDASTGLESMPENNAGGDFDFGSASDELSDNVEEDVPF